MKTGAFQKVLSAPRLRYAIFTVLGILMTFAAGGQTTQPRPGTSVAPVQPVNLNSMFHLERPVVHNRYPDGRTARAHPRYPDALRVLGQLGFNEDQVLGRLLTAGDVDVVLEPGYSHAVNSLGTIGISPAQALAAIVTSDNVRAYGSDDFRAAYDNLRSVGLNTQLILDLASTRERVQAQASRYFMAAFRNLRSAGVPIYEALRVMDSTHEMQIMAGNHFAPAFRNLLAVGLFPADVLTEFSYAFWRQRCYSGMLRMLDCSNTYFVWDRTEHLSGWADGRFISVFRLLSSLLWSTRAILDVPLYQPNLEFLAQSRSREVYLALRSLGVTDTDILRSADSACSSGVVLASDFPRAFQALRSLSPDLPLYAVCSVLDLPAAREIVVHHDFRRAVRILTGFGIDAANAISLALMQTCLRGCVESHPYPLSPSRLPFILHTRFPQAVAVFRQLADPNASNVDVVVMTLAWLHSPARLGRALDPNFLRVFRGPYRRGDDRDVRLVDLFKRFSTAELQCLADNSAAVEAWYRSSVVRSVQNYRAGLELARCLADAATQ